MVQWPVLKTDKQFLSTEMQDGVYSRIQLSAGIKDCGFSWLTACVICSEHEGKASYMYMNFVLDIPFVIRRILVSVSKSI